MRTPELPSRVAYMGRAADSPAVLGRYGRAAGAPQGLRKALALGEVERAMAAVDSWRMVESRVAQERGELVAGLRARGASWDGIGWLLGTTGWAVRKRYGGSDVGD